MTFAELATLVRKEIIVDAYEDAYENEDVDDALWRATFETAVALGIPRAFTSGTAASPGATTVTAPSDTQRILGVSIAGDEGAFADLQHVIRTRFGGNRALRYWNYDPRRGGLIEISPPSVGGAVLIEYAQQLTRPSSVTFAASTPWNGVLPQFHPMIAYRAGVALFQMDERENEVQHWQQEYQLRFAEASHFLAGIDTATALMTQGGAQ